MDIQDTPAHYPVTNSYTYHSTLCGLVQNEKDGQGDFSHPCNPPCKSRI